MVWLRARPGILAERVAADGVERPLLRAGALPTLTRLADTRAAVYTAVADATVTTDDRTPDEVTDAVLEELARCAV